jgi:alpha-tubulin suppressor-like RCC1 family protein
MMTKRYFAIYACGEGWTGALGQDHLRTSILGHYDEEGDIGEEDFNDTTSDNSSRSDADGNGSGGRSADGNGDPDPPLLPIYASDDVEQASVGWGTTAYLNTQGHIYMVGKPHDLMSLLRMARMPKMIRDYIISVSTTNSADPVEATFVGKWISQLIGWATGTTNTSAAVDPNLGLNDDTWDLAQEFSWLKDWTHLDLRRMSHQTGVGRDGITKDTQFNQVVCGPGMTALVGKDNGRLYMMGINNRGQCGVGRISNNVWVPEQVQGLSALATASTKSQHRRHVQDIPVIQVALGFQHGVALTQDGQVYTWGKANRGQLGRLVSDNDQDAVARPIKVPSQTTTTSVPTVVQISAGHHHGALLTYDNRVFIWGKNMGRGTTNINNDDEETENADKEPTKPNDAMMPEQVLGLPPTDRVDVDEIVTGTSSSSLLSKAMQHKKVLQISCGSHHTAMLLEDGSIYAVGVASDVATPILDPVELVPPGVVAVPVRFFEAHSDRTTVIDHHGHVYQAHLWNDVTLQEHAYFTPSFVDKLRDRGEDIKAIHRGWKHTIVVTK